MLFAIVIREKGLLQIESTVKAIFYKVKMDLQATMENEEPICSKSTKLTLGLPLLLLFESGSVLQAPSLESHVKDWTTYVEEPFILICNNC